MNIPISAPATIVVGLAAALLFPTPSHASPAPASPAPQTVKLVQTKHADVDGDGRRDTVRIYNAGTKGSNTVWKVKVTTAAGKTSAVSYTNPSPAPDNPWYGWAKLDGHRGAELLLNAHTDDFFTIAVITWRGGKLRLEAAPEFPSTTDHDKFWSAASETNRGGYRFFTASGRHYVNVWQAECPDSQTGKCTVKTKRSVWKNSAWRTVKTLPTTKIAADTIYAHSPLGALVVHS